MQTIQWKKSALKTLTIFAFLGGAFYTLTPKSALAQTAPPTAQDAPPAPPADDADDAPPAPPANGPRGSDLRPIEGTVKVDPSGRLIGPDAGRGPRDHKGPRDERDLRGPEDGPRGPKGGPRDRKGPRDDGPDADRGPEDGPDGPRGPKGGPRERGPKDGPDGPRGPRDDKGPRHHPGPANARGGPRDRGPEDGPRDGGPDAARGTHHGRPPAPPADANDGDTPPAPPTNGPAPDDAGPKNGADGAMQRAYRGAAELDHYGQLQGDMLNLTGQARSYYTRANEAHKSGNEQQAVSLARISERLTQAALHLARAQHGPLPVAQVVGWQRPTVSADKTPTNNEQPREFADLTQRLQNATTTTENSTWHRTAQKLATQAHADWEAKRFDASRERAHAAMTLLDAADMQAHLASI